MQITPETMKLKRVRFRGEPAWLWIAPTGKTFYMQQCYRSTKWIWNSHEDDKISSEYFDSLYAIKDSLAQAFSSED